MPVSSSKESTGVTEKLEDFFRNKLDSGIEIKDKNQYKDLAKSTWSDSEINLKRGSRDLSYKALNRIMKEKGMDIPEGIGKLKKSSVVGEIEASFEGTAKKIVNEVIGNPQPQNNQGYGIYGNPNQPQIPQQAGSIPSSQPESIIVQRKILTDSEKASNKRFIKQTMQLPKNLWVQFGIVDSEDLTEQQKPKKWGDEVDEWAESLADWCNENGYSFPAKMEMILLGVTGISLFIFPLLMKIMGAKAEKKKEKKKTEPNELDKILEKENLV